MCFPLQTIEERDRDGESLRRQLDEARAAADRLPEQQQRCQQLSEQLRQLRADRDRCATETEQLRAETEQLRADRDRSTAETERLRADRDRSTAETERLRAERDRSTAESERLRADRDRDTAESERLSQQLRELQTERDSSAAELDKLRHRLQQVSPQTYTQTIYRQDKLSPCYGCALRISNLEGIPQAGLWMPFRRPNRGICSSYSFGTADCDLWPLLDAQRNPSKPLRTVMRSTRQTSSRIHLLTGARCRRRNCHRSFCGPS